MTPVRLEPAALWSRVKNHCAPDSIIQDQIHKGVIEKVDSRSVDGLKHYLSHQAVINPHKPTTNLRVVYDASAIKKE